MDRPKWTTLILQVSGYGFAATLPYACAFTPSGALAAPVLAVARVLSPFALECTTLNPDPLNPKPETRNPKPETRNPTPRPQTPNSQPSTQNCKSGTTPEWHYARGVFTVHLLENGSTVNVHLQPSPPKPQPYTLNPQP